MSPSPQLAPPGSSSYSSNTLHVGDGTWDSSRDDFLLPNLVGVNFATMQYNGMSNRFFSMTGYHSLVKAHGIIAAITFLAVVPAAIMFARFYGRRPFWRLRLHIWLNILILILTTVVFILGNFAVGPDRSLTNPHHGIGVAIFVLVIVQVFGGALAYRRLQGKSRLHVSLRSVIHQWLGRIIALLAITQVALGLTLYGSPKYLFVLYTLWGFALFMIYFILSWAHQRSINDYDSRINTGGEVIGEVRPEGGHRWAKILAGGAAGLGLAELLRRRSSRNDSRVDVVGTDESGTSYEYEEEEKQSGARRHGWGRRLLEIGAIGGGLAAMRSLFRRRANDSSSDIEPYRPPLGGNQIVTSESMSRIEEGRPPVPRPTTPQGNIPGFIRPTHPLANPPMTPGNPGHANSASLYSSDDYMSGSPSRRDRRGHGIRDVLVAGVAALGVRQLFKSRRQKADDRRAEELRNQRIAEERIARENSRRQRFTGDGITPPRRVRPGPAGSVTGSDFSESIIDDRNRRPGVNAAVPAGVAAAAAGALAERDRIRPVGQDPVIIAPGGPTAPPSNIPPLPPGHRADANDSSGSEVYTAASGRPHHRHHLRDVAAAGLAGAALGAAATEAARRRQSGRNTDSLESPPVSLHVRTHKDGRHVTLRRLTEEEALAEREARRRERRSGSGRQRRNSSLSSSSGGELTGAAGTSTDRRWRRTEALERQQEAQAAGAIPVPAPVPGPSAAYPTPPPQGPSFAPNQAVDPRTGQVLNLPPPPPIPETGSGFGAPPGSYTSPGTETSGPTDYANNRRRRRAQRAQAKLAREGRAGGGNSVEYT